MQNITVIGVSWSGEGDKRAIVISCKYKSVPGQIVALNTPRILLATEKLGIEEDCEEITNRLRQEVYEYIFEGKQDQLELGLGDEEN